MKNAQLQTTKLSASGDANFNRLVNVAIVLLVAFMAIILVIREVIKL